MIPYKVPKKLSRLTINQPCLDLSLFWWSYGFPKKRKSKKEERRRLNKSTNSLAVCSILPELTPIPQEWLINNNSNNNQDQVKDTCKVPKAKEWCQTNTTKEVVLVFKEVAKEVAEAVCPEEVTEVECNQAVINNITKDKVLCQVNINNIQLNISNQTHNNLEWSNLVLTLPWECHSNKCNNLFLYCHYQRLIYHTSIQSKTLKRRSNSLVTQSILRSRQLSDNNWLERLPVCWLMKT